MATAPSDFVLRLELLQYSQSFKDFPKNFTLPSSTNPNYIPPYNAGGLLIYSIAACSLMTIFVVLRLYVRARVQKKFGIDDWLIIPALIFSLGGCVVTILVILKYGVGKHVYDVSVADIRKAEACKFPGVVLYYSSVYFTKMSIVAFLFRIIERTSGTTRVALHVTSVAYTLMYFSSIFAYSFSCQPLRASWDVITRIQPTTKCIDINLFIYLMGIFYAVGDFWLLLLPIPKILSLSLPFASKMGMIFVLSLGLVACVGSVIKLVYIGGLYNTWDPTWNSVPSLWGSTVEFSAGIICACLPSLSVLIVGSVKRSVKKIVSSNTSNSRQKASGNIGGSSSSQDRPHKASFGRGKSPRLSTFNLTRWGLGLDTRMSSNYDTDVSEFKDNKRNSYIDLEKAPRDETFSYELTDISSSSAR